MTVTGAIPIGTIGTARDVRCRKSRCHSYQTHAASAAWTDGENLMSRKPVLASLLVAGMATAEAIRAYSRGARQVGVALGALAVACGSGAAPISNSAKLHLAAAPEDLKAPGI